jgi:hypothetical protein
VTSRTSIGSNVDAFLAEEGLLCAATAAARERVERWRHAHPTAPVMSLADLLSVSDFSTPATACQREWLDAPAVGREVL